MNLLAVLVSVLVSYGAATDVAQATREAETHALCQYVQNLNNDFEAVDHSCPTGSLCLVDIITSSNWVLTGNAYSGYRNELNANLYIAPYSGQRYARLGLVTGSNVWSSVQTSAYYTMPPNRGLVYVQYHVSVATSESSSTQQYDRAQMTVIRDSNTGPRWYDPRTWSNLDGMARRPATNTASNWQVSTFTVPTTAAGGQTWRVLAEGWQDVSNPTAFYFDNIQLYVQCPVTGRFVSVRQDGGGEAVEVDPAVVVEEGVAGQALKASADEGGEAREYATQTTPPQGDVKPMVELDGLVGLVGLLGLFGCGAAVVVYVLLSRRITALAVMAKGSGVWVQMGAQEGATAELV